MDQLRVLLAIALSFIVFFVWNLFFIEQKPVGESGREQSGPAEKAQKRSNGETRGTPIVPVMENGSRGVDDQDQEPSEKTIENREIFIDTPLYRVLIDERGAVFKSFILKDYREDVRKDAPLKELISAKSTGGAARLIGEGDGLMELNSAVFSAQTETDVISIEHQAQAVRFLWKSSEGLIVEKRYTFHPESYLIDLEVLIKNATGADRKQRIWIQLEDYYPESGGGYAFEGASALINKKLEQIKIKKIEDKGVLEGEVSWIALEDRYFMKSIIPIEEGESVVRLSVNDANIVKSRLGGKGPEIISNGFQETHTYKIFFGPKSMRILRDQGYELNRAIHFGMFDFIAKPLLWFMNFIYGFIPNYGVAIILLTIVTKILLWPLGNKSYKSMNEMKRIQPLMAEVREKHKSDKKMMNQEMMALYRTYKINPMGGCLPMLLQIPVFFALYRMLYQAIELRHAPFFLWINDLSAPDRLFRFGFSIPLMQPPYGVPVLTLVMGATMLLQQKMSPPPGDPAQAKMMMLMPIVFTFIFINFSSGLVLYWLVNNVLSIAQQYYIQKKYA